MPLSDTLAIYYPLIVSIAWGPGQGNEENHLKFAFTPDVKTSTYKKITKRYQGKINC
jgi:hypothetical protein